GGHDDVTGINQIAYTAQFGNGVSASLSVEDPSAYNQAGLYNTAGPGLTAAAYNAAYPAGVYGTNSYAGTSVPDIVGQLRVDQAWGLFQLSAAGHQVRASYYNPALETTGHPGDKWGYAAQAALSIKNLPTGPGDSINVSAGYAHGATRYVLGGVTGNSFAMYGSTGVPGAYQSIAVGGSSDGVFASLVGGGGTSIELTTAWGVRGAFNHNWNPYWSTSLFGAYTAIDYNTNATALICAGWGAPIAGFNCNPDFRIAQIGTVTRWTPVTGLTFSGEVMYTYLDQGYSGTAALTAPGATKPAGLVYEFKDQGTWSGALRAQRTF
ncbi:porin, partial [Rhodopseudomonas palustris]